MQKDNSVIFKGGKDGIIIMLSESADYDRIAASMREKIRSASKFFADATTTITFKGKKLSESELLSLIDIVGTETDLNISFVEDLTGEFKISPGDKEVRIPDVFIPKDAYVHKAGLRSGQLISQNGTVVILGDVNAGAEVVAAGNVVVFGRLRGMVHAGVSGDTSALVCALSMQPIQLRIADKITYFPKEIIKGYKDKIEPVYAFVKGDEIYVAPITN